METKIGIAIGVVVIAAGAWYMLGRSQIGTPAVIGGERDVRGCLTASGYAFDEYAGACTRGFELTPDIRDAARLAVSAVGRGYALTVVAFNSYEERGAYDIMLERGSERAKQTVIIRNGEIESIVAPAPIP